MSKHRKPPLAVARAAAILALGIGLAPAATLHAQAQPLPVEAPSSSASQTPAFDIPAQSLSKALAEFARQSGLELLYTPEVVEGRTASAISGQYTREAAMTQLLQGTDLDFVVAPSGGMVIGDRAMLEAHRTRMRGNGGASVASPDGSVSLAEAVPGAPALTGESIISTVETARRGGIEEIIVTGQKKEERLQDVPIAISAFSAEQLDAQKIEGGFDLLKAVPNVTFSKSNYSSYNFSIRGVGTKAVSATADPGVAISFNNVPLIRNRLFEQEYFDVERVEVLRGPQGTLYGRNATGGVVNMITNKPDFQEFEGMLKAEAGNYDARRMTGMINVPIIDDVLALRIAGATTQRDGYGINLTTGKPSDDRDLWSSRITLGFRPNDRVRANFIWEHFNEDDSRLRTGKQLCHRDEGPEILEGVDGPLDQYARGRINQGCKIGSLYDDNAFGKPNGWSLPFTYFMANALFYIGYDKPAGQPNRTVVPLVRRDQDPYGYDMQSRDLRAIESIIEPKYRAEADIFAFNLDVDLTDTLLFSSQTAYNEDYVWSLQDYMRFSTPPAFNDSNLVYGQNSPIPGQGLNGISLPGGVFTDPQIGPSNTLKGFEVSSSASTQFSQEFRLQSDFDAPLNFSLGINYLSFKGNNDYYLFFNIATMIAEQYYNRGTYIPNEVGFVYVDRSPFESIAGDGHNYFRNQNPYELESRSAFGELYWQVADSVKLTAGLRYTDDKKKFTPWPSHLLVTNEYGRYGPEPDIELGWDELTGRLGVDWSPALSFTDQTLVYAFYSRGYKGGGANPPPAKNQNADLQAVTPAIFDPEYVDAFEIGSKNTILGGSMTLNGSAFYYDYQDYQVSKVQDRTVVNENFDAKVWGAELEALWRPLPQVTMNAAVGYLRTRIADGERSLDIFNRAQGRPGWMTVTPYVQQTSNCIMPVEALADAVNGARALKEIFEQIGLFADDAFHLGTGYRGSGSCGGYWFDHEYDAEIQRDIITPSAENLANPEAHGGQGFLADIGGNELPNSPRWTLSLGADYTWDLKSGWAMTLRGDYYQQTSSWSRVYAEESDRLRGWDNVNFSLTFAQPDKNLAMQVYVKNAFDETPVTDAFLNSDSTGMTTNIFTLDPRLIGVSVRVGF